MKRLPVTLASILALIACQKVDPPAPPPPVVPTPQPLSAAEWRDAVAATMVKERLKDKDGVQEFFACFAQHDPGRRPSCTDATFEGRLDGFDRAQRYQTVRSLWLQSGLQYEKAPTALVAPVIVLSECDTAPAIVLRVHYAGKAWMFLKSVAVLADGNVALERTFASNQVRRDNDYAGVLEHAAILLEVSQWTALRTAASAKALHVRVTGDKGYVMLNDKQIAELREDVAATGRAHDKLKDKLIPFQQRGCLKVP